MTKSTLKHLLEIIGLLLYLLDASLPDSLEVFGSLLRFDLGPLNRVLDFIILSTFGSKYTSLKLAGVPQAPSRVSSLSLAAASLDHADLLLLARYAIAFGGPDLKNFEHERIIFILNFPGSIMIMLLGS